MPSNKKRNLFLLLILIGLLMVFLAVSLPDLQMRLGENLYARQEGLDDGGNLETQEPDNSRFELFMRIFSTVVQVFLIIYIISSLFSKEGRKRLFETVGVFIFLILMILFFRNVLDLNETTEEQPDSVIVEVEYEEIEEPPGTPVDFEPETGSWIVIAAILVGAGALAVFVFFIISTFSRPSNDLTMELDEFVDKAQSALNELSGAEIDFEDIIIRYYAEMNFTLQDQLGIERQKAMTTFEFEQQLINRGFPAKPVQQLTQLFEQVRYGHQQTGEIEKRLAVESLRQIIEYCRASNEK